MLQQSLADNNPVQPLAAIETTGSIDDLKQAKSVAKDDSQLNAARNFQRRAQFFVDFVEAENSMGFHAPQEAARILAEAIDAARKGQVALRDGGRNRGVKQ